MKSTLKVHLFIYAVFALINLLIYTYLGRGDFSLRQIEDTKNSNHHHHLID